MTVAKRQTNLPHIFYIDIKGDGLFRECAVLKEDNLGNITFIDLTILDDIDKKRIAKIVSSRNAPNFELWDLMSNTMLNNGMNALEYFHQLAKVISPDGTIYKPSDGVIGASINQEGVIDTNEMKTEKQPTKRGRKKNNDAEAENVEVSA